MNSLTPKTPETIYYTAVSAKLLKSYFSRWPTAAILDFCQLRLMPTLLRETPLQFHSLTFKEEKNTKKRTFTLHGHGSAPDDPTNPYFWRYPNFFITQIRIGQKGNSQVKTRSIRLMGFDTIPACDGKTRTDGQRNGRTDRHATTAYTALA